MPGFLLGEDAVSARRREFEDWLDLRKRQAEETAAPVMQTVAPVAEAASTAIGQLTAPLSAEAQARRQQFEDWRSSRSPIQAPEPTPAPRPITAPTPAPSPLESIGADVESRRRQFADWLTSRTTPEAAPVAPEPALPHAEEPATQTDVLQPGPDLGGKWKTSFDFGSTYTGSYRTGTPHRGIDLVPAGGGGIGTAVEAFSPGTVTNISRDSGAGGLMVYVQDDAGLTHAYMHLAGTAPGLKVGQRVNRGDLIAQMGESGTEGSPHLHYEVRKNASTGDPLNQLIDPRPYMAGQAKPTSFVNPEPVMARPRVETTAGMSGGGDLAGKIGQRGQDILSGAAEIGGWLGAEGQKALQSILITEGGLSGARGDSGASAGPLQFFGEEGGRSGQLNAFAKAVGLTLEQARAYAESHPLEAIAWAVGTATNPGYLGLAIARGIAQNMYGPELATYAQRTGQVSVSPERAGQVWQQLFGQGQDVVSTGARRVGEAVSDVQRGLSEATTAALEEGGRIRREAEERATQSARDLEAQMGRSSEMLAGFERRRQEMQAEDEARRARVQAELDRRREEILAPREFPRIDLGARAQEVVRGVEESPFGQAWQASPINPMRDIIQGAQRLPEDLGAVGRGLQAASTEAERQTAEPPQLAGARLGAELAGQRLTPQIEEALRTSILPSFGDAGGVVSAFLKSSGIVAPEVTVPIPALGDVPLADIIGLGANLMIPTGAEARFGAGPLRTFTAGAREARPSQLLPGIRGATDAANMATSQIGRWARAGIDDIARELGQSPLGRFFTNAAGELDTASLRNVASKIKLETQQLNEPAAAQAAGRRPITAGMPAQAQAMLSARLGGGVAGLAGSEATMSEEERANPFVRVSRDLSAMLLGQAAPGVAAGLARGIPQQLRGRAPSLAELSDIRSSMARAARAGPPAPPPGSAERQDWLLGRGKWAPVERETMTPAQVISAVGKQNLLFGIKGQLSNIGSQMVELARLPATALMAGQGDQAAIGMRAGVRAIPDMFRTFAESMRTGVSSQTRPGQATRAWMPVYRFIGAVDDAFRVVGANMSMAMKAQQLVNEASAKTPEAIRQVVQANQDEIYRAGERGGAASVFQTIGAQGPQDMQNSFGRWKEGLLGAIAESPAWQDKLKAGGKQALGLVVDALVPFAGMPKRLYEIGITRTPIIGEARRFVELANALRKGDTEAAQRALGELGVQSLTSSAILSHVFAGNITGPDDKDHPNSVLINGQWVDYSGWGAFQLPLALPAATVDAMRKTGNTPDAQTLDYIAAVMNAWGKTMVNASYLNNLFDTIEAIGQGGLTGAISKNVLSYTDRASPAFLNQVEQMIDNNVREVSKQFPRSVVDRVVSRVPYLAETLPAQVEQTTGGERQRERQGPIGVLFGVETAEQTPIEREIWRLNRLGYSITPPREYPQQLTVKGASIRLNEQEQRQLARARGERLERIIGARMASPAWNRMSDDQKARAIASAMQRASTRNAAEWRRITPVGEQQRRVAIGRRVQGRLVNQPDVEMLGFRAPRTVGAA